MSYQIIYRGLAIKTSRGILPIFENGSNNVRVMDSKGNMVREKYWSTLPGAFVKSAPRLFNDVEHAIKNVCRQVFADKIFQFVPRNSNMERKLKIMFMYPMTIKEAVNFGLCYYEYIDFKPHKRPITDEASLFSALEANRVVFLTDVRC